MIITAAWKEFDLTGDLQIPAVTIIQRTHALLHCKACDSLGNVIDLDDVNEIKAQARNQYSSIQDPIFTASLLNGKATIVDANEGLFDIQLEPTDTDFEGSAVIQFLYHTDSGQTLMSPKSIVNFASSYMVSDVANPPEEPLSVEVDFTCPITVEVGDLVYVSGSDAVDQAIASDPAKIEVIGHVTEKPTTTTCKVSTIPGPVPCIGISPPAVVYLSATTPGKVTSTPPALPNALVKVGVSMNANSYFFSLVEVVT